jgi:hypothetical protein
MSKKSGKSLKEKRAIKRDKSDTASGETVFSGNKKR